MNLSKLSLVLVLLCACFIVTAFDQVDATIIDDNGDNPIKIQKAYFNQSEHLIVLYGNGTLKSINTLTNEVDVYNEFVDEFFVGDRYDSIMFVRRGSILEYTNDLSTFHTLSIASGKVLSCTVTDNSNWGILIESEAGVVIHYSLDNEVSSASLSVSNLTNYNIGISNFKKAFHIHGYIQDQSGINWFLYGTRHENEKFSVPNSVSFDYLLYKEQFYFFINTVDTSYFYKYDTDWDLVSESSSIYYFPIINDSQVLSAECIPNKEIRFNNIAIQSKGLNYTGINEVLNIDTNRLIHHYYNPIDEKWVTNEYPDYDFRNEDQLINSNRISFISGNTLYYKLDINDPELREITLDAIPYDYFITNNSLFIESSNQVISIHTKYNETFSGLEKVFNNKDYVLLKKITTNEYIWSSK